MLGLGIVFFAHAGLVHEGRKADLTEEERRTIEQRDA